MEKLLTPDIGLSVWTVLTFVVVVAVLGKYAWGPLLAALEARESGIKADVKAAADAREAAEKARQEFERRAAEVRAQTQSLVEQAVLEGQKSRDALLKTAREEADSLAEKTRRELAEEKRRLVSELRAEVANLAVDAAVKVVGKSVDKHAREAAIQDASKDLESWSKGKN